MKVGALADQLGVPFRSVSVLVLAGPNLEARAREVRHSALEAMCPVGGRIALGHTADDVAENVLLRLIRGTGLDGTAAMALDDGIRIRPVLRARRSDTQEYCRRHHLAVVDDAMNGDPRFQRVRVRNEVIPMLNDIAQRDVVPLLARFAAVASEQRAALEELTRHIPRSIHAPFALDGINEISNRALAAQLRAWWGLPSLDRQSMRRVIDIARGDNRATEVAGGEQVVRREAALYRVRAGCDAVIT